MGPSAILLAACSQPAPPTPCRTCSPTASAFATSPSARSRNFTNCSRVKFSPPPAPPPGRAGLAAAAATVASPCTSPPPFVAWCADCCTGCRPPSGTFLPSPGELGSMYSRTLSLPPPAPTPAPPPCARAPAPCPPSLGTALGAAGAGSRVDNGMIPLSPNILSVSFLTPPIDVRVCHRVHACMRSFGCHMCRLRFVCVCVYACMHARVNLRMYA